jgi:hypothetical protein
MIEIFNAIEIYPPENESDRMELLSCPDITAHPCDYEQHKDPVYGVSAARMFDLTPALSFAFGT